METYRATHDLPGLGSRSVIECHRESDVVRPGVDPGVQSGIWTPSQYWDCFPSPNS